jgi:hypothetical protein
MYGQGEGLKSQLMEWRVEGVHILWSQCISTFPESWAIGTAVMFGSGSCRRRIRYLVLLKFARSLLPHTNPKRTIYLIRLPHELRQT